MSHIWLFEITAVRLCGYAALFAVMLCFTVPVPEILRGYAARRFLIEGTAAKPQNFQES